MKKLVGFGALFVMLTLAHAQMVISPWLPQFKGIDLANGTNQVNHTINTPCPGLRSQVVRCLRIDLSDPDIQLFTTPRAPSWVGGTSCTADRETLDLNITNFIRNNGVQVASDANFYNVYCGSSCCTSDPANEGVPSDIEGLLISKGQVVSYPDNLRYASLLFTTNKVPTLNYNMRSGTTFPGIYTAMTGVYPVLTNGVPVPVSYLVSAFPNDGTIHNPQPRTAFGLSQDRRYLFMLTIDGRQCGYSEGADDSEIAAWMIQFGAWDAINMDGGGSTCMYSTDSGGTAVALNYSSKMADRGYERFIGCHFGVFAKPVPSFINDVQIDPYDTTANITWTTIAPATTLVEFGTTPSYGSFSANNPMLVTNHVMTLNGLTPFTTYYFQIDAVSGGNTYSRTNYFTTIAPSTAYATMIFDVTNVWKYNTANFDSFNWQYRNFSDNTWPSGPGLLFVDTRSPSLWPIYVYPRNTQMPDNAGTPFVTYYFRTHFNYTNSLAGVTLTFSNFVDDGAVFSLNGTEIYRLHMPPAPTYNATPANGFSCGPPQYTSSSDPHYGNGCTNCPEVFTVAGSVVTNLVSGDNVLAVEVHNYCNGCTPPPGSPDITFGSALMYNLPVRPKPKVKFIRSGNAVTLYWNGSGYTLQQTAQFGSPTAWTDVPGPVMSSPYTVSNFSATTFYSLR